MPPENKTRPMTIGLYVHAKLATERYRLTTTCSLFSVCHILYFRDAVQPLPYDRLQMCAASVAAAALADLFPLFFYHPFPFCLPP